MLSVAEVSDEKNVALIWDWGCEFRETDVLKLEQFRWYTVANVAYGMLCMILYIYINSFNPHYGGFCIEGREICFVCCILSAQHIEWALILVEKISEYEVLLFSLYRCFDICMFTLQMFDIYRCFWHL